MFTFRNRAGAGFAVLVAAALALTTACSSGGSGAGGDDSEGTFKIALVDSSGGAYASANAAAVEGAAYAAELINDSGGINGYKIEVVKGDMLGEPANAVTLIPKLAGQDVIAIVGPATSAEVETAFSVANQLGITAISPGAARVGVLDNSRPNGWSVTQQDVSSTTPALTYVMESNGYKSAAMISDRVNSSTAAQVPLLEAMFESAGVKIVADQEFTTGDSSFASQVTAIKQANPEVIALAAGPEDAGRIAREIRSQGIDAQLIGTAALQSGGPAFVAAGGDATEGTIAAAQFDSENPSEPAKSLLAQAKKDMGLDEINLSVAYGFDAMNMIAKTLVDSGIKPSAPADEIRAVVQAGIMNIGEFEGMSGKTSFADDGTGIRPILVSVVVDGEFVVDEEVD